MTSYVQSAIRKLFGTPEYRLLIVGLDAAGKTTVLYRLKLNEVVTTIPTIGFNVETVTYKKANLTLWDIGGRGRMRAVIRHYLQNTQGLLFVVDACDRERLPEVRDNLQLLMTEDELREAPLLIYLNKMDLPKAMEQDELVEQMQLHSLRNRLWHVQPCSATAGEGLYEGLDWLLRALKSPHQVLKPPVETTTESLYRETNKSLQWLSQEDEDSSEEFIDKFRQHQLHPEQFDHRSLLRIIWTYLQLHTRKETIKTVFEHLPFYITDMNETLIYFWIQIVHYAREATKNPTNDFAGFLLMNPQLLNEAEVPLVYYKKETLVSKQAKASVVLPDVKPLPSILPSSSTGNTAQPIVQRAAESSAEELTDEEFLNAFESCRLSNWSHRTHIRMAWLYLQRDGRRAGVKKIFDGIKNFIANSPLARKTTFHFTMTYFWIQMIDLAIAQSPQELSFDEFLRLNPQLLNGGLFLEYYKKETMLNNPVAREGMVLPDIKPLPTLVISQNKK